MISQPKYDPYKLLIQEVILYALRDYARGYLDRPTLVAWTKDKVVFAFYARLMGVSPTKLRTYIKMKMKDIDDKKPFTDITIIL